MSTGNPHDRTHGPWRTDGLFTVGQAERVQALHCRNRPACLRIASDLGWKGLTCVRSDGETCDQFQLPDPVDLAAELIALSAFATWLVTSDGGIGEGHHRDEARAARTARLRAK